jgi:hypothetical protein
MTIARRELIDVSLTRWYHCATRCDRRAFLLGDALLNRKEWVEDRIEELAQIFAVGVGGFSVMDNHVFREGKAAISAKLAGIFDRLGIRAEDWQARMEKLRKGRL